MSTSPLADRITETVKAQIRAACSVCGGSGVDGQDAVGPLECEYCGRPMQAVGAALIDAQLAEVREGYAGLVRSVEVQGKLVGYQSDVLDRARPGLELITQKGTP